MKQLLSVCSLLLYFPLYAEPIGDFAPLEVGNRWVYRVDESSSTAPIITSTARSTIDTIFLIDLYDVNDSIYYRFKWSSRGRQIVQDETAAPPETTVIADSGFYSLVEVNDTIGYGSNRYLFGKPVLWTHYINSDTLCPPDFPRGSLSIVNGVYEFSHNYYVNGPMEKVYRADVGLVYESTTDATIEGFSTRKSESTLLSFTKNNVVQNTTWRIRERKTIPPHLIDPKYRVTFSQLVITRHRQTFNLMGRMFPANTFSTQDPHRYFSRRKYHH
ncbi:MAG: hypothetical protein JW863_23740 [Chitinispirillaceae bacterium]|nr:hypothetical protein [Chitinispirillaceae bacterium]